MLVKVAEPELRGERGTAKRLWIDDNALRQAATMSSNKSDVVQSDPSTSTREKLKRVGEDKKKKKEKKSEGGKEMCDFSPRDLELPIRGGLGL